MSKWYGSVNNRIMERGKSADPITVGMGVTEFFWSDRHAYEVTQVINQKEIYIREYDHIHKGAAYTNDWELVSNPNNPEIPLKKRGKYWYNYATVTREELEEIDRTKNLDMMIWMANWGFDRDTIFKNGKQTKYHRKNIVIGYADYYYDYEF
jgi:hypothetical protein